MCMCMCITQSVQNELEGMRRPQASVRSCSAFIASLGVLFDPAGCQHCIFSVCTYLRVQFAGLCVILCCGKANEILHDFCLAVLRLQQDAAVGTACWSCWRQPVN
jgi:hypothetical protein